MGESFGVYRYGADEQLMPYISSANVACGFHGGDPSVMRRTVQLAKRYGVHVGAHVGFPDKLGFGRRYISVSPEEARDYTVYQMGALDAVLRLEGMALNHLKFHGALYMMALTDYTLSAVILKEVAELYPHLKIYTIANSETAKAASHYGLVPVSEYFVDRPYYADTGVKMFGWTVEETGNPRQMAQRVLSLVTHGEFIGADGQKISLAADTVCIHSDTPDASAIARILRETLRDAEIAVGS
ncbi:LamB/YcsF family protein [Sulfobacillus acidophilus TPY]|nr:LamB/YcsF family protein [Sulfobacillus acidophilus TPY]